MTVNNSHNDGARETNKIKNRQAIIEAGIQTFIAKGVAETTVRDIIRSTGLASGTFYNYFNSKEEEVTEPKVGEIYSLTKRSFPSYTQIIDYCNKNDIKVDVWEKYFKWEEEEKGLTKKYFELEYQREMKRRQTIYDIQNGY